MGAAASFAQYMAGTPGPSGFGSGTNAIVIAQANNALISGRTFIVTGANAGIGKETARVLASQGGTVVLACRSLVRGEEAAADIRRDLAKSPPASESTGKIHVMELDLGSFESIRAFASAYRSRGWPANVLICNAGVMAGPRQETADGLEYQIGINHFGHYLLCLLMLPILRKAADAPSALPSRIVMLSSAGHQLASPGIDFDDVMSKKSYSEWRVYGRSKLANILFVRQLSAKLQAAGLTERILVNAVHPGGIKTNLQRSMKTWQYAITLLGMPLTKSIPQGAATSIYAATDPRIVTSDQYYADCNVLAPHAMANDSVAAAKLWKLSEELTNERFPFE